MTRNRVMQRANITDVEEFWALAEYLYEKGWIAEPDADYGIFVITVSGIEEAAN